MKAQITGSLRKKRPSASKSTLFLNFQKDVREQLGLNSNTFVQIIKRPEGKIELKVLPKPNAMARRFVAKNSGGYIELDPTVFGLDASASVYSQPIDGEITDQSISLAFDPVSFMAPPPEVQKVDKPKRVRKKKDAAPKVEKVVRSNTVAEIHNMYLEREVAKFIDLNVHRQKIAENEKTFQRFFNSKLPNGKKDINILTDLWIIDADEQYARVNENHIINTSKVREALCANYVKAIISDATHGFDAYDTNGRGVELKSFVMYLSRYGKTPLGAARAIRTFSSLRSDTFARWKQFKDSKVSTFNKPTFFFMICADTMMPVEAWYMDGATVYQLVNKPDAKNRERTISISQFEEHGVCIDCGLIGQKAWIDKLPPFVETLENMDKTTKKYKDLISSKQ